MDMRPGCLEHRLITNHPDLKHKPIKFLHAKINLVKRLELDSTGHFQMEKRSFNLLMRLPC